MRGATAVVLAVVAPLGISIHAPHAGRDTRCPGWWPRGFYFNPRAPCGARRPDRLGIPGLHRYFNPRAPCGARRGFSAQLRNVRQYFNPRAPCGARLLRLRQLADCLQEFQSTRPMRGATAKVNKLLCTFLQKRHGFQIFLRKTLPFKAFCRLQIGKNFSICGANRCGNFCELLLRTIRSSVLPEGRSACSQNAQFYSHTFSRDNRNADCLFPDP